MASVSTLEKLIAQSLTPIAAILADTRVTEIMVNADGNVFVEAGGSISFSGINIGETDREIALRAVAKAASGNKQDLTPFSKDAVVSTSFGALRFAGALKGVDARGTCITIRKHRETHERPDMAQLIEWGMLTPEQSDKIVDLVITQRKNCVFAGPTSGGKTTLANAVCMFIPEKERVGLIEDAREMAIKNPNRECLLTNPDGGLTAALLVKHGMRSRFDRLILGETRGDDTFDLLRALSSGHDGSITTIHASSAIGALATLEMLFQMSLPPGVQMSPIAAMRYIANCIHMIVYCERKYQVIDGEMVSKRRVSEIVLLNGVSNGDYVVERI